MNSSPTVDDMMVAYAGDGVAYAAKNFGVTLDYSEASVELVEGLLAKLFDGRPKGFFAKLMSAEPTPEQIDQISKAFGGYVGEVMKRHWGGQWKLESAAFPGQKIVTLGLASGGDVWPQFKVGKRLTNGPADNVWHYFQILRQRHATAHAGA